MNNEMYRINYAVDMDKAICTVYKYPILAEKNSYFLIRSGMRNRQIKKEDIGQIRNTNTDRTAFYVFLTDLTDKDVYINEMVEKVKKNAQDRVRKFQSIYENALQCDVKIVDVEPE